LVSSDLLRAELLRATRRAAPEEMTRARAVIGGVTLLSLPTSMFERAAELDPLEMRSVDAVHLAEALALGDDLDAVVGYDRRLLDAARAHGLPTISPAQSKPDQGSAREVPQGEHGPSTNASAVAGARAHG
jgi:hypothetical protein